MILMVTEEGRGEQVLLAYFKELFQGTPGGTEDNL
jgi:hypothetical protein